MFTELETRAARAGGEVALLHKSRGQWQAWTWAEVRDEVARAAQGWRGLGLTAGDRVLIFAANRPRALFTVLAVRAAGGVGRLVDPALSGAELRGLLESSATPARYAFVTGEEDLDRLDEARDGWRGPELVVYDDPRGLASRAGDRTEARRLVGWERLLELGVARVGVPSAGLVGGRGSDPLLTSRSWWRGRGPVGRSPGARRRPAPSPPSSA